MTQPVNAVGNALHNAFETLTLTTPHHTYIKNTSSRNDQLAHARENGMSLTSRIREIDELDAAARTVGTLRPDWDLVTLRAVLARDRRPWSVVVTVAVAAALDDDVRLPARIETYQPELAAATPLPPSLAELRDAVRCDHGAEFGHCALCRVGVA